MPMKHVLKDTISFNTIISATPFLIKCNFNKDLRRPNIKKWKYYSYQNQTLPI